MTDDFFFLCVCFFFFLLSYCELAVVLVQIKIEIYKALYGTHSKDLSSAPRSSGTLDLSLK